MLQRKKYTREFKIKAIELAELKRDVTSVAEVLGVERSMIYRWKREWPRTNKPVFQEMERQTSPIRSGT